MGLAVLLVVHCGLVGLAVLLVVRCGLAGLAVLLVVHCGLAGLAVLLVVLRVGVEAGPAAVVPMVLWAAPAATAVWHFAGGSRSF